MDMFDGWFVDCILICARERIGPDEYIWDLHNRSEWRKMFDKGMTPRDAVTWKFCEAGDAM